MLQKKLLSGLFWVLLLNLIIKPFWILGIEVGVQNAVGTEAYGFYFTIFNLAYILNILLDVGITNYNTRNIARNPHLVEKYLSGILTTKVALLLLYVAVAFTVGWLRGFDSRQFAMLAILCCNQALNSLILYLRSNYEALLLFRWDSVLSVLDRVAMIVICGAMLWGGGGITVFGFALAQTAAYLITAVTALTVLARHTGLQRLRVNRLFTLAVVKQSLPYALLVLLMATYNRLDPLLLQQLLPADTADTQVGIYAGAFRLLDALTMIAYLVSVPLLPVFARLTKSDVHHAELQATVRWVFAAMAVYAVGAAVTLSGLSGELMAVLYDDHAAEAAQVFSVLVYGIVPIGLTYIFGTLLTAAGRMRQLNMLALCTVGVNVAANLLLIPHLGAVGSAWASLTAQSFMAVAQTVVAMRLFGIRFSVADILKTALFTLTMVAYNLLLPPMAWWLALGGAVVLALAVAAALRMVDMGRVRTLLKDDNNNL